MLDLDLNYQASTYSGMVGKSRLMQDVFRKIDDAASIDVTVLVLGETGVGKELTARAIHSNSRRRASQYVPLNCAAIPESLFESELYGHARGAFTGAVQARKGKFRMADGGTLYLDEIGSMPKDQQSKLLRVLDDMLITPVGSDKADKVDVRVIAGTNQDLYKAIREGTFRDDLFYRLAVETIHIPPLRERIRDIPMLIKYFMEKYQKQYGKIITDFTPSEYIEYMRYSWHGNVRELENAVKGIIVSDASKLEKLTELKQISALIRGGVIPTHYIQAPENGVTPSPHVQLPETYNPKTWRELQRNAIIDTLAKNDGNRTQTAKELGISLRTLRNHLRKIREELEIQQKPETESQIN